MKISRLKNKKFIGLSKDFLLILAILDKISKKLKNDEKRLKIEKKVHFIDQKLLKIVKICLILQKIQRFPQNGSKLAKNFGIGVHFFFIESIADVHFFGYTVLVRSKSFFFLFGSHIF